MTQPVTVDGRVWHSYMIEFESPDGKSSCEIFAISDDHAHLQLDALKETGRVVGRIQPAPEGAA